MKESEEAVAVARVLYGSLEFFRENTWFLENNRTFSKFCMRFCIT